MNKRKLKIALKLAIMSLALATWLYADGLIIINDPVHQAAPFSLEVKYHDVNVKIKDMTASTFVDQEFYNPNSWRLEGTYLFPVPKGSVINKFSMFIDGKEVEAELLDSVKARKIYEDIVRRQKDPALLEYSEMDLFRARIFPIEPRSTKRVKISYTEILQKEDGNIEYRYPLGTEKFSAKPINDVSIKIDIDSQESIKNIYCPSHSAEIKRTGEHSASVSYGVKNSKPDTDFEIFYNTDKSKIGFSFFSYKEGAKDGYFFLNIAPSFEIQKTEVVAKDITFVLDTSGSMSGEKLEQAKKALLFCIDNLNKNDHFEIVRFSTEAEALFNSLVSGNEENLQKAKDFIKNLKATGGTHIEEALNLALSVNRRESTPYMVIFITDGKPTIGETDETRLLDRIKKANTTQSRIFTFGIGYEINTHLLDKITELTKAYRTYISPKEDIELKVSNFYKKIQYPLLTGLKLQFDRSVVVSKVYPKDLPDLFRDDSITVLGEYRGEGKTKVVLEGMVGDKKESFEFSIELPDENTKNEFIPALWAVRRIGFLLDQIRLNGENNELKDEVITLARQYGIVTPYTSYLILEDEAARVSNNELDRMNQTFGNALPQAPAIMEKSKKAYSEMKADDGAGSVKASEQFMSLNRALDVSKTREGLILPKDDESGIENIEMQVKNVQGRAFYNSSNVWIDSKIQGMKTGKTTRIKFASDEYFDLIKKNPKLTSILSLGKNVRFVFNNTIYEVFDK